MSKMVRISEIQDRLLNLVGWEQSYNPAEAIDEKLTESESGLYYQGAHPLVTLENLRAIIPDDFFFQYTQYSAERANNIGDKVRQGQKVYVCTEPNVGVSVEDTDYWHPYNYFSDFLERMTRNGIATAVQTFLQIKDLKQETKTLLERHMFFDGAGRRNAILPNRGKLVGFEIEPVRAMGVTAKIERVGLQMTGGTGTITLYLFHSSQIEPVKTFTVEYTKTNGGFQWFTLSDVYLPYISDENNAGGSWFLCYDQNALPDGMQAINMSKDWSREPCGTCNQGNVQGWREMTKYLQVSPFQVNAPLTFAQYPEMWDIEKTGYTNTQNYGLNCEVTVGCDLTDFIIEQRGIFATVLQKQIAAIALRTMALNPSVRVNRNQSNVSMQNILYELDGNTQGRQGGIGYELKKAYEALSLNTQGIDRICLTCNNHGVKYRTV